jgi:hypothetical protein
MPKEGSLGNSLLKLVLACARKLGTVRHGTGYGKYCVYEQLTVRNAGIEMDLCNVSCVGGKFDDVSVSAAATSASQIAAHF